MTHFITVETDKESQKNLKNGKIVTYTLWLNIWHVQATVHTPLAPALAEFNI
jgi:hypothetical protein